MALLIIFILLLYPYIDQTACIYNIIHKYTNNEPIIIHMQIYYIKYSAW